jgi:hypothetical protein
MLGEELLERLEYVVGLRRPIERIRWMTGNAKEQGSLASIQSYDVHVRCRNAARRIHEYMTL